MTALCPPKIRELFPKDQITKMETCLNAYDKFLQDSTLTGQVAELSIEKMKYTLDLKQQEVKEAELTANAEAMLRSPEGNAGGALGAVRRIRDDLAYVERALSES